MKPKLKILSIILGTALIPGLGGCNGDDGDAAARVTPATPPHPASAGELRAIAQLEPTQGHHARGTVRFLDEGGKVRVTADITGLAPGEHGFHIHESGDCSAADASSAGGHFNPTDQPHASRDAEARHLGDLGNLRADQRGRAQLDYIDANLSLGGPDSIVGRAIIVHAGRDDLKSQPSGDSGARLACGTIELARKNF